MGRRAPTPGSSLTATACAMHPMPCPDHSRERGVTLIEMVIVIAITAIIAGAVAVFISRPVEGYADAARRAEMTDIADTALRRITRDLRTALSNSIRITCVPSGCAAGSVYYLEYLQSSGGGRYRTEYDNGGGGNILDFTNPLGDSSFDVIGAMPTLAAGDSIVDPQPTPPAGGSNALLATDIAPINGCSFTYVASGAAQRMGVVMLSLKIQQGLELIQLFQQVHVTNVP